jgi:hypothetical protein
MIVSDEKMAIIKAITDFDAKIDRLHLGFEKYHRGDEPRMPDWQNLESELVSFSRRKIYELEVSNRLDRVLYKFQNRKKIWLTWAEEVHRMPKKKPEI